jgi:hypothetical protein
MTEPTPATVMASAEIIHTNLGLLADAALEADMLTFANDLIAIAQLLDRVIESVGRL